MSKSFQNVEPIPVPHIPNDAVLEELAGRQMLASLPRDIPFKVIDLQDKQDPSLFLSIAELLRYRASNSQGRLIPAFSQIDDKGKELTNVTWEKLDARAEKVALVIQEKSGLKVGDCVALIYRKSEIVDFIVSLLGCFIAGMVAVPINAIEDLSELWFILRVSKIHLVLTTENNLKTLTKSVKTRNSEFPKNVDWWPTNDFGSLYTHQIKSGKYNSLRSTPLAYIEFTKSINGELKGVAVSHHAIMSSCHSYTAGTTETIVFTAEDGTTSIVPNWDAQGADILLTYLDSRQQLGLNLSVLGSIYNGSHTIFANATIMETPAAWIYVLSKYKVTIALAGYPGAFYATKYYQKNTKEVLNYSKKSTPDLSALRLLFIDTILVKPDVNEFIANKLLKPLIKRMVYNTIDIITPILSLPEHGGVIVSFRDFLGPGKLEEFEQSYDQQDNITTTRKKTVFAPGKARDIWECVLDASALRQKKVAVLATSTSEGVIGGDEAGYLRVSSHGFPFPNMSIAIVDPETTLLCPSDTIGEIWVDAPSLGDGFWGIPALTEVVYQAIPILVPAETLQPEPYNRRFVRTGLIGTMIGGRLVVLGTFEDRIRQQRLDEPKEEVHIGSDLTNTITKKLRINSCTAFDIYVNGQYLPVVAIELNVTTSNEAAKLMEEVSDTLLAYHGVRVYAVFIVKKGQLPRFIKDGNQYIHHLLTKRRFLLGQLPINHIKIDVDNTIISEATSPLLHCKTDFMSLWHSTLSSFERATSLGLILPSSQPQHSGIEVVKTAVDERTGYDLSRFTNMIDIILWRTSLYPEENVFISAYQGTTKSLTWRKFNYQIASIAHYFIKKCMLKPGTRVMVFLHFHLDLVRTLYACFVVGLIPVLCSPLDLVNSSQRKVQHEMEVMIRTINDLNVQYILVSSSSEDVLRHKTIATTLKLALSERLPVQINIEKAPKYNKLLGPESGLSIHSEWASDKTRPAFILIHPSKSTPDYAVGERYITYTHDNIVSQCRSQKLTCQIKFQNPLVATGTNDLEGLGLLYAAFCGIYAGCSTILISSAGFQQDPLFFFELVARNRCSTVYANYTLFECAMSKIAPSQQRQISLQGMQNVMLAVSSRANPKLYERISRYLSLSRLEKNTINTVYSHPQNPMITTRSFMLLEPLSLVVDTEWLKQGIICPTDDTSRGILLQDSGIVPTNTMIAIVNPATMTLCPSNVMGEIWVTSDSNIKGLFATKEEYNNVFEATIKGADPRLTYMRTGDVGFLWKMQRGAIGTQTPLEEGQCLFVLGHLDEIIVSKGLFYFPMDIEKTVESSHQDIIPEGCYAVQATNNEIILIIAIQPGNGPLLSIIPVIVNSVLERHALLVDTIVMVERHQLPKRHNETKLRKKILSMYIQGKM
ncbi:uncharacterized protein B0P05DRAFT_541664 [Gilbertella persicaria]|uniref:uncharacterized protein n=1 Tax=Gilbertella persicaria TaxID=101096 RepID=UPI002220746A|nr:uncharacterized protein B0P05DRAFT_541664 [Gilbertella persicaria]KAI8079707.1 hypothetical protein B0P05DRAFT_541664 [Gilbertella persicaria]